MGLPPDPPPRRRLCFVVSTDWPLRAFVVPHLRTLAERFDLTAVANAADPGLLDRLGVKVPLVVMRIQRPIAPWADLRALIALWSLFRRERFDAVHSITPKAGLLASLAGFLAGIPLRVHTFTGQVWATRRGVARAALKSADRLIAALATNVFADSASQLEFITNEGVVARGKGAVLAGGSICGVDPERFRPDPQARAMERSALGATESDVVYLFIGRLTRDKGLLELAQAFARLAARRPEAMLVVAGPDEGGLVPVLRQECAQVAQRLALYGFTDRPERLMAAADVLCLPSHREGFGSVVIEAAACGAPAVVSAIYGLTDAVQDGVTGLLHPAGDDVALERVMERMLDPVLRRRMGEAARERALRDFSEARVTGALAEFYEKRLG